MEYRGIEYNVLQALNRPYWKWVVRLDEKRMKTGGTYSRVAAVRLAQVTIDQAIKNKPQRPKTVG
jgi:hypothetical protein